MKSWRWSSAKLGAKGCFIELSPRIAGSGPELVAMAREFRPDIVISDNRMPNEHDGIRAIEEIMQFLPGCRCILWSADDPNSMPAFPGEFVPKVGLKPILDAIFRNIELAR